MHVLSLTLGPIVFSDLCYMDQDQSGFVAVEGPWR